MRNYMQTPPTHYCLESSGQVAHIKLTLHRLGEAQLKYSKIYSLVLFMIGDSLLTYSRMVAISQVHLAAR